MKVNSPSKVPSSSPSSCRPYRKTGVEKTEQWDALPEEDHKAPQGFLKQRWSSTIHCATSLSLCLSNYQLAPRAGNLLCCATLDKKGTLWKWSNSEELVTRPVQGRTARSSPLGSATTLHVKRYAKLPPQPRGITYIDSKVLRSTGGAVCMVGRCWNSMV